MSGDPLPPTSRFVDVGGPIHVLEFGAAGDPVVLIHGGTASAATWVGLAEALAPHHRVLAIDLLGHGETPLAGRRVQIAADRDIIAKVLDGAGWTAVTLVAMTRGTIVAAALATSRPDLAARLVFVEPPAFDRRHPPRGASLLVMLLSASPRLADAVGLRLFHVREGARAFTARWLRIACTHPDRVAPETVTALDLSNTAFLQAPQPFIGWTQAFAEIGRLLMRGAIDPFFVGVAQPTVVVAGRDTNSAWIPLIEQFAARHRWPVEILDGVGHPPLEAPAALASIIERRTAGEP